MNAVRICFLIAMNISALMLVAPGVTHGATWPPAYGSEPGIANRDKTGTPRDKAENPSPQLPMNSAVAAGMEMATKKPGFCISFGERRGGRCNACQEQMPGIEENAGHRNVALSLRDRKADHPCCVNPGAPPFRIDAFPSIGCPVAERQGDLEIRKSFSCPDRFFTAATPNSLPRRRIWRG